jgi:hypothetical protein
MASGNQGKDWKYGQIEITINSPSGAIYFEAELNDYDYGDIALDKIKMKKSQCDPGMSKYHNWKVFLSYKLKCILLRRKNINNNIN